MGGGSGTLGGGIRDFGGGGSGTFFVKKTNKIKYLKISNPEICSRLNCIKTCIKTVLKPPALWKTVMENSKILPHSFVLKKTEHPVRLHFHALLAEKFLGLAIGTKGGMASGTR